GTNGTGEPRIGGGEMRNRSWTAAARLAAAAAITVGAATATRAAPAEVRGTWLTTTGPDHIRSGFNTGSVMSDLRAVGLNTVYVETWKNGYTNFPSPTLAAMTGGADRNPILGTSRDLVEETIIEAHRNEMTYIAWFEYGFAAEFVDAGGNTFSPLGRTMRDNGWLLRDQNGQLGNATQKFAWMNPAVPEVRQFLIDISLETVRNYGLDGLQFDDRLSWPRDFGWDATTANLYFQETGRSLPSSVNDSHFRNWRQSKVTLFAEELTTALRAERPDLHLSVSPSVTGFSDVNFNAEWGEWQDDGLFDEYAVQVYRSSLSTFNSSFPSNLAEFTNNGSDDRAEFVVGLRGNGDGANTPYADLEDMIDASRASGAAGHSIFYSKAVRDDYAAQLTAYYDVANLGHAESPLFPSGYRPPPAVGASLGGNEWLVDVPDEGAYTVNFVNVNTGRWETAALGYFPAGQRELTVFNASEVELLRDYREAPLPDFNGDGVVDAADYTLWADNFARLTDVGDADGDGFVTRIDYDLWAGSFGRTAAAAGAVVPTPAASVLAVLAASAAASRKRSRRS
ncbi:MAG: family 10 glycosylhydrolase, partial [Planctomycetota bacterium]